MGRNNGFVDFYYNNGRLAGIYSRSDVTSTVLATQKVPDRKHSSAVRCNHKQVTCYLLIASLQRHKPPANSETQCALRIVTGEAGFGESLNYY